jgi:hypothetical protein
LPLFGVVEGGEEIEAGAALDIIDGSGVAIEWADCVGGVGNDGGIHRALVGLHGEDHFVDVGGDGDVVGADDFGDFRIEEGTGEDVDGVGVGGEAADRGFELGPRAGVHALDLGDGVGEQESRANGLIGEGEVGGGSHVAAGESAVLVVGVVGSGGSEIAVMTEVRGSCGAVLESRGVSS